MKSRKKQEAIPLSRIALFMLGMVLAGTSAVSFNLTNWHLTIPGIIVGAFIMLFAAGWPGKRR